MCLWFESRTGNKQKSLKRKQSVLHVIQATLPSSFHPRRIPVCFLLRDKRFLALVFSIACLHSLLSFHIPSKVCSCIFSLSIPSGVHLTLLQSLYVILILCIPPACLPTHLFLQIFLPLLLLLYSQGMRNREDKKKKENENTHNMHRDNREKQD